VVVDEASVTSIRSRWSGERDQRRHGIGRLPTHLYARPGDTLIASGFGAVSGEPRPCRPCGSTTGKWSVRTCIHIASGPATLGRLRAGWLSSSSSSMACCLGARASAIARASTTHSPPMPSSGDPARRAGRLAQRRRTRGRPCERPRRLATSASSGIAFRHGHSDVDVAKAPNDGHHVVSGSCSTERWIPSLITNLEWEPALNGDTSGGCLTASHVRYLTK
jgi:hypothetical protein